MFGKSKKPKYMNTWYEVALNSLGSMIARDVKQGKKYENIPFGLSLLDIYDDGDYVFITVKTMIKGEMVLEEYRDVSGNLSYYLQFYKFQSRWEKADTKVAFTKETLKQVSVAMATLVSDSDVKNGNWIFPYYDEFITVRVNKTSTRRGRKWISGAAYRQSFNDEYGCGGGVSGVVLEADDKPKIDKRGREEYIVRLDQSIHSALGLEDRLGLMRDEDYNALSTATTVPTRVLERVS